MSNTLFSVGIMQKKRSQFKTIVRFSPASHQSHSVCGMKTWLIKTTKNGWVSYATVAHWKKLHFFRILHTNKFFLNLDNLNQIWVLISLFRLIWHHQTEFRVVPTQSIKVSEVDHNSLYEPESYSNHKCESKAIFESYMWI